MSGEQEKNNKSTVEQKDSRNSRQDLVNDNAPLTIANLNTTIKDTFKKFHTRVDKTITGKLKAAIDPLNKNITDLINENKKLAERISVVENSITPRL